MAYRVLNEFRALFEGRKYLHRDSSRGDFVAMHVYEDLSALDKSAILRERIQSKDWVLNSANRRQGVRACRGDGTFGEKVPGAIPTSEPGYQVARAKVATVEIGVEVKILAKAMIKQIDRVMGDLQKQVTEFRRGGGNPICIGIVGINHAPQYTSYEGDRVYRTDGSAAYRHPYQEAPEAERRLLQVASYYNEFIILRFSASNEPPFPFSWVNLSNTNLDYGSALVRVSREYDKRS